MEAEVKNEIKSVFDETVKAYADKVEELEHKVKTLEAKPIVTPMFSSVGKTYKGYRLENQLTQLKEKGFSEEKADFVAKAMIEAIDASKHGRQITLKAGAEHVEGTPASGGYLVIDDYYSQVETGARDLSVMASLCRNVSTSSDTFKINANDAEFAVAIDGEGTVTKGSGTLKEISIPVKRLSVYGAVSNELLADANWDVTSWITEQITYKGAQTLDSQILNGTGNVAGQLNSGVLTAVVTNSVTLAGISISSILASDFSLAMTKVSQMDRSMGTFVFGETGAHYLRTLKDTSNAPIYQAIANADLNKVYGKNFVECASIDDSASVTETCYGVFGNFNQVFLVNRTSGFDLLVDPYSDSISNNTRFIFSMRKGFGVVRGNALCRFLTA